MKTLHWYLLRQVLATLAMTVVIFTFILLLGESLKEMLALLVNGQVSMLTLLHAIALLLPFVLVFALPMGLLTAMLLVFGRFSADQELTAARACGVSLVSLVFPVIGLSVVCAGLCAAINMEFAPQCRNAYKSLLLKIGTDQATSWLTERTFIRDFPGCILYAGKVDGLKMEDVLFYQLDAEGKKKNYLRASQGNIEIDRTNRTVSLTLLNGWELISDSGPEPAWHSFAELQVPTITIPAALSDKPRISNMSSRQLWKELRDLEARLQKAPSVGKLTSQELQQQLKASSTAASALTEPIKLQIHRQASFSFACVGFALVGIPLGIRAHRRETSVGFALSLLIVLAYYSFFILAQTLETRPDLYPHLIVWVPNFLFQGLGIVLLRRANRGV